jgi:hypothetical protein
MKIGLVTLVSGPAACGLAMAILLFLGIRGLEIGIGHD